VEFSSFCQNDCFYCGLRKKNRTLNRYRLDHDEILKSIDLITSCNIKTVVLQSGEDNELDAEWLAELVRKIRSSCDIAVTLSVGEYSKADYKLWKEAGADRYLLKIETTDEKLYSGLHPGMSFENRLQCLKDLKDLGYQVGSGIIVGLPDQTAESLARDILFFQDQDLDMIGIGPFIPHERTPLAKSSRGELMLTLKALALTRIVTRNSHLPATTALGSLGDDHRIEALEAGANILMPNFTPAPYRKLYEIYPGKRCVEEPTGSCAACMDVIARSIGRYIDYSRGDSLKVSSVSRLTG
jgi:biotin synthase